MEENKTNIKHGYFIFLGLLFFYLIVFYFTVLNISQIFYTSYQKYLKKNTS